MEFNMEKSALNLTKSVKRYMTEVIEQVHQVVIRTLGEKETYKYQPV